MAELGNQMRCMQIRELQLCSHVPGRYDGLVVIVLMCIGESERQISFMLSQMLPLKHYLLSKEPTILCVLQPWCNTGLSYVRQGVQDILVP